MNFQSQAPEARRHYVDVLRGVAALAVLLSHGDHARLIDLGMTATQKGLLGTLGVHVFFVLSGYLIWISARASQHPGGLQTYAIHRLTRLLPLYLVNVAFAMWLLPHLDSAFTPNASAHALLRHLTFTQDLLPIASRDLNPVLWTLTHEALFYALAPLLVLMRVTLIPVLALAMCLLGILVGTPLAKFFIFFPLFAIGILFAEKRFAAALLGTAALTAARLVKFPMESAALLPASALVVLVALGLPSRGLWLTAPLKWLGAISFSVYIWHYLLINMIGTQSGLRLLYDLTGGASYSSGVVRALCTIAAVLLVSVASYWAIERPSMNQLRRYLTAKAGRSAPALA